MDELDKLKAALKAAPPPADPARKAETLARALENFDQATAQRQEKAKAPRPMTDRPNGAGFLSWGFQMFSNLASRPTLVASTAVAAVLVGLVVLRPEMLRPPVVTLPAPETASTAIADTPVIEEKTKEVDAAAPAAEAAAPAPAVIGQAEPEAMPALKSTNAPMAPAARADAAADAAGALAEPMMIAPPAPEPAPGAKFLSVENTEAFANAPQNPVKVAAEDPVSTFSVDVDTASWSVVRSSLSNGYLPPPEAVRVEEMVNYFPYSYPAPKAGGAPFSTSVNLFQTPWNKDTEILRIGLQGALPATDARPPLNLVFLIDTSGSMDEPNKLPLLQQSFRLMLSKLRPEDRVAIVTYAGSAGLVLEPTEARDKAAILGALDRLAAGGSTAGAEGLMQAYQVADGMKEDGRISRILLATDGDFNVGISDPEALKTLVADKRKDGAYLSVLGFGRGNLDDATMQALAQNGNGTASYIDTLAEAQKVLVDQLTGALFPIADDVKIQIEFNPAKVAEYRLIGYETRALNREDFNNDKVDAGEIGAGLQVTALYEVTPVGSPAILNDALRYAPPVGATASDELAFLKLRWKAPGEGASHLIETPVAATPGPADADARFATAIAGMGQLLGGSKYLGNWGWADAIALANGAKGEDPYGYRAEAVQLMRLGESLSGN